MLKQVSKMKLEGKSVAMLDCAGVRFVTSGESQAEALKGMQEAINNYLSFTPITSYESVPADRAA